MGRECVCTVQLGTHRGEGRALLESSEIELRGVMRTKLPFTTLVSPRIDGTWFEAQTAQGMLRLDLGAGEAAIWLDRVLHPPSLASKLGVAAGTPVYVVDGHTEIRECIEAAGAALVALPDAKLVFVAVETEEQLRGLAALVPNLPPRAPLWVVRCKGRGAKVTESAILSALRELGPAPSKCATWSDHLTADRFGRARSMR